jgi:hypothetical protein
MIHLCDPGNLYSMIGQYGAVLVVIIVVMMLVDIIDVTAQSQNVTNATDIGENQSISGRISGFGW